MSEEREINREIKQLERQFESINGKLYREFIETLTEKEKNIYSEYENNFREEAEKETGKSIKPEEIGRIIARNVSINILATLKGTSATTIINTFVGVAQSMISRVAIKSIFSLIGSFVFRFIFSNTSLKDILKNRDEYFIKHSDEIITIYDCIQNLREEFINLEKNKIGF